MNREHATASYYAHTMPGLEGIAWTEIKARLPRSSFHGFKQMRRKNGLVLFTYDGAPDRLLELRTTEDVFFLVERIPKLPWGYEGLSCIYETLLRTQALHRGLAAHHRRTGYTRKKRLDFRVVARMAGRHHPYRRLDLARSVQRALEKGSRGKWHGVQAGEDVEIWANLIGLDFICGLRLSGASMRHRSYKRVHLPASLRPSVAAAMVRLTEPDPSDVFLDPMCGAGTLLIERGMAEQHALLLGGDIRGNALRAAAANVGPRHKPRQLVHWDARHLPLNSHSVGKVATNLPFGLTTGSRSENPSLYRAVLGELDRVLTADGCAVMLSNETQLIRNAVRQIEGLQIVRGYSVTILGRRARVYLLGRPT